jgi:hypothetical protein
VIGTVDDINKHVHSEIFLVSSLSSQGNQFLVHPQLNAFATVSSWNTDTSKPTVDATVVHSATVGNATVFEIHAHDQTDMAPAVFNGIYAICLYIDDNPVDHLTFAKRSGRWLTSIATSSS